MNKNIITGFIVGILANIFGIIIYILLFSKNSIEVTLEDAIQKGYLGSLIALGGILNLVAFFGFIRIKNDDKAKGVLLATILLALVILFLEFS